MLESSQFAAGTMLTTVRTWTDNGPYFASTRGCYQAATLKDLLFHVRQAFEDREDVVGVFDPEGNCKGIWVKEIDGYVDSAGDSIIEGESYEFLRPDTRQQWVWGRLQERLRG